MRFLPQLSARCSSAGRRPQTLVGGLVVVSLAVAVAVVPGSALAAKPTLFHDQFADSFPDQVCGTAVDIVDVGTDNFFVLADGSIKDTHSVRATLTNPLNGKSVVVSVAGQTTVPPPTVDNTAGTITFATSFKGLPERIQTPGGTVLLRDAGVITFVDTFDAHTGEFISERAIVSGPHPGDSNSALFCSVITGALS